MIEEWKDIDEVIGYQVSNKGRVKRNNLIYSTFSYTKYGKGIYLPVNGKAELFIINDLVEKYFGELLVVKSISSFVSRNKPKKCCNKK